MPGQQYIPVNKMTVNHSFQVNISSGLRRFMLLIKRQTLFAVPLSCEGCVKSVSDSLYSLGGITKVEGNVKDQLISVEGSGKSCAEVLRDCVWLRLTLFPAAPSAIVEAIQGTGRDAILRGSGASNSKLQSAMQHHIICGALLQSVLTETRRCRQ